MAGAQDSALDDRRLQRRRPRLAAVRDARRGGDAARDRGRSAPRPTRPFNVNFFVPPRRRCPTRRARPRGGARSRRITASSGSTSAAIPRAPVRTPFDDDGGGDRRGAPAAGRELPLRPARRGAARARPRHRRDDPRQRDDGRRGALARARAASTRSIAQGLEAGGHRGHFLSDDLTLQSGLFALLPQIVAAVRVPVIAARRHRRRRRRRRRARARRGDGPGRHRLPALPGSDDARGPPRRARQRGGAAHGADAASSPAGRRAASSIA